MRKQQLGRRNMDQACGGCKRLSILETGEIEEGKRLGFSHVVQKEWHSNAVSIKMFINAFAKNSHYCNFLIIPEMLSKASGEIAANAMVTLSTYRGRIIKCLLITILGIGKGSKYLRTSFNISGHYLVNKGNSTFLC